MFPIWLENCIKEGKFRSPTDFEQINSVDKKLYDRFMIEDNFKENKNRRKTMESRADNMENPPLKELKKSLLEKSPPNKKRRKSHVTKKDDSPDNVANEILNVIGDVLGKKEKNKFEKECGFRTINSDIDELTKFNKNVQKEIQEDNKQSLLTNFFGKKREKIDVTDQFDERLKLLMEKSAYNENNIENSNGLSLQKEISESEDDFSKRLNLCQKDSEQDQSDIDDSRHSLNQSNSINDLKNSRNVSFCAKSSIMKSHNTDNILGSVNLEADNKGALKSILKKIEEDTNETVQNKSDNPIKSTIVDKKSKDTKKDTSKV